MAVFDLKLGCGTFAIVFVVRDNNQDAVALVATHFAEHRARLGLVKPFAWFVQHQHRTPRQECSGDAQSPSLASTQARHRTSSCVSSPNGNVRSSGSNPAA